MKPSIEQVFRKIYIELVHKLPNHLQESDIELLVLFIGYTHFRQDYLQFSQDNFISDNFADFIRNEIAEIASNKTEVADFSHKLINLISENSDELNGTMYACAQHLDLYNPNEFFDICVNLLNINRYKDTRSYITPKGICRLSSLVSKEGISGAVQDLFSRKGEWGSFSYLKAAKLKKDVLIQSLCFDPYHYLIAKLRARLLNEKSNFVELIEPYNLSEIDESRFDVVLVNPPFGKVTDHFQPSRKDTTEAFFLRHAIIAAKDNGKIAFVVPESFLFRKEQGYKCDYELREELTNNKAIKAIFRLPDSTFLPFAKIRTALLIIDYERKHRDICFVDIKSNPSELTSSYFESLNNLINHNGRIDPACNISYEFISHHKVKEQDFDWQLQIYTSANKHKHRPIEVIKNELEEKDIALKHVTAEIEIILTNMANEL